MRTEARRGWLISALIGLCSFCFHLFSIDLRAPSLTRTNLVLDADIEPVARVIAEGHMRQVSRHPLYGIFLGGPGQLVQSVLHDRMLTGQCFSAAMAAVASLTAFWSLDRLLKNKVDALGFCLLASCSASVWLMGSVPETHIFNYASVVLSFWLLGVMSLPSATQVLGRLTLFAILIAVFMAGVTLTNIAYIALGFGLGLLGMRLPPRERLVRYATFLGGFVALFAAASALQLHLAPREVNLLKRPTVFLKTEFIDWSRGLEPGLLLQEARMFLLGNIIASRPQIELVETVDGTQQMIQLAAPGRSELVIVAYVMLVCAVLLSRRSNVPFGLPAWLAGSSIAFVFAIHLFFFGNGQPFIFSIQTVFPLVVLFALVYRQSRAPAKRLLLFGLVCILLVHNGLFMFSIDELLSRKCSRRVDSKICRVWDPTTNP